MKLLALAVCLCLAVGAYGLGLPDNRIYIEYVDPSGAGNWTDESNWASADFPVSVLGVAPSTVDDALVNHHNEPVVTLRSGEFRVVRTLVIGSGNNLVIEDNSDLAVGPELTSPPGSFVDVCTGETTPCPTDWVQSKENQAFCIDCSLTGQVANKDQTECVFCPAGKVFNGTLAAGMRCQNCTMYQDSDGEGSECRDCPAHFSSFGGEPCFPCPPPTDSHSGGPCLFCLPDLRDLTCPDGCNGVGTCVAGFDPITIEEVEYCDCPADTFGPTCLADSGDYEVQDTCFSSCSITVPFPFGQMLRDAEEATATATGPIINLTTDSFFGPFDSAYRMLGPEYDFEGNGLINPYVDAPENFAAVQFGFELNTWNLNNQLIQELLIPFVVQVPYDQLRQVDNPWKLELFYYNIIQSEWVQATRNCIGEDKKRSVEANGRKEVLPQQGIVEFEVFQSSAQFQVFALASSGVVIEGTPPGALAPNPTVPDTMNGFSDNFNGGARPPHITTGITGVLPVPPQIDPGLRPTEPNRKPITVDAANTVVANGLLLLIIAIVAVAL